MRNQCESIKEQSQGGLKSKPMKRSGKLDTIQILSLLNASVSVGEKNSADVLPMQRQRFDKNSTREPVSEIESLVHAHGRGLSSSFAQTAMDMRSIITTRTTPNGGVLNRFALHAMGRGIR
jgi:hypothetical protein